MAMQENMNKQKTLQLLEEWKTRREQGEKLHFVWTFFNKNKLFHLITDEERIPEGLIGTEVLSDEDANTISANEENGIPCREQYLHPQAKNILSEYAFRKIIESFH